MRGTPLPNYEVTIRVETKRDTLFCSQTAVVSGDVLPEARELIEDILVRENSFISVTGTDGSEVFIPREEIATITICKEEAEDE